MAINSKPYPFEIVGDPREVAPAANYRLPLMSIANFLTANGKTTNERFCRRQDVSDWMGIRYGWENRLQSELLHGGMGSGLTWTTEQPIYQDPNNRRRCDLWGIPQHYQGGAYSNSQSVAIELKCGHEHESNSCRAEFMKDVHKVLNFGIRPEYIGRAWGPLPNEPDNPHLDEQPGLVHRTIVICVAITAREEDLYDLHRDFGRDWSDEMKANMAGLDFYHKKLYNKMTNLNEDNKERSWIDLWMMWTSIAFYKDPSNLMAS